MLVETKLSEKNMLCKVLIVYLDYFLVGVCWLKQNLSQTICKFKLMLGMVLSILDLSQCVN